MLKKLVIGVTLAAVSLALVAPASALTNVPAGSVFCQTPVDPGNSESSQYSMTTQLLDSFSVGTDPLFGNGSSAVAVDNTKNLAYMVVTNSIYATDIVAQTESVYVADNSDPFFNGEVSGLAVDDATGAVYEASVATLSELTVISKLNTTTQTMDEYITLNATGSFSGAGLAWHDGHFYSADFQTGVIHVFDGVTGDETGTLPAIPNYVPISVPSIDVMPDGTLFVLYTDSNSTAAINFYSLSSAQWVGPQTDATVIDVAYDLAQCTVWGGPEPTPTLPNTGIDGGATRGAVGGAVSLALAGIALVALRRRAA